MKEKIKFKLYKAKDIANYFEMKYTFIYANHIDSVDLKFPSQYDEYNASKLHYTDTSLTKILIFYKRNIYNFTQYFIQKKDKNTLVINNRGEKIKMALNKLDRQDMIVFTDFVELDGELYVRQTDLFTPKYIDVVKISEPTYEIKLELTDDEIKELISMCNNKFIVEQLEEQLKNIK